MASSSSTPALTQTHFILQINEYIAKLKHIYKDTWSGVQDEEVKLQTQFQLITRTWPDSIKQDWYTAAWRYYEWMHERNSIWNKAGELTQCFNAHLKRVENNGRPSEQYALHQVWMNDLQLRYLNWKLKYQDAKTITVVLMTNVQPPPQPLESPPSPPPYTPSAPEKNTTC